MSKTERPSAGLISTTQRPGQMSVTMKIHTALINMIRTEGRAAVGRTETLQHFVVAAETQANVADTSAAPLDILVCSDQQF